MTYPRASQLIREWVDDATRNQAEINTVLGKGQSTKIEIWLPRNLADTLAQRALLYYDGDMSALFEEVALIWFEQEVQPAQRVISEDE